MPREKDWSMFANDFDERQDFLAGEQTVEIIEEYLNELKDLGMMLELGCGNGKYTKIMARNADSILATDVSSEMLGTAQDKLKSLENVQFECSNCYNTNYNDTSFDSIFMGNLIHVVLEPHKALVEAHRVLKDQGKLILLSFTADGMSPEDIESLVGRYIDTFGSFPEVETPMTLKRLAEMVEESGFVIQRAELIGEGIKAIFVIADKRS